MDLEQAAETLPGEWETKDSAIRFDVKTVDDQGTFEGYAAVFGNVDDGNDIIHPGAFTRTLKGKEPDEFPILWQHDRYTPIGLPLNLEENKKGLITKGQLLLDIDDGIRIHRLMKHKVVKALSIGFTPLDWKYKEDTKKGTVRHLYELELWEYSPVVFPMNRLARIRAGSVKSISTTRHLEEVLREGVPLSRQAAKYIASRFQPVSQREAGDEDAGLWEAGGKESGLEWLIELAEDLKEVQKTISIGG